MNIIEAKEITEKRIKRAVNEYKASLGSEDNGKVVVLLNKSEGIYTGAHSLRDWMKEQDSVFRLGAGV